MNCACGGLRYVVPRNAFKLRPSEVASGAPQGLQLGCFFALLFIQGISHQLSSCFSVMPCDKHNVH